MPSNHSVLHQIRPGLPVIWPSVMSRPSFSPRPMALMGPALPRFRFAFLLLPARQESGKSMSSSYGYPEQLTPLLQCFGPQKSYNLLFPMLAIWLQFPFVHSNPIRFINALLLFLFILVCPQSSSFLSL